MSTMKYRDLKEMTFKEWDGKPFRAIVTDYDEETLFITDKRRYDGIEEGVLVTGYDNERWLCKTNNLHWKHAYPMEWNKKPKKLMTNRQLAMWLAKGNGQMMHLSHVDLSVDETACVQTSYSYYLGNESFECDDRIRVRKGDCEEWVEPTTDLLEER